MATVTDLKVRRYIAAIRNPAKQFYARSYWAYLTKRRGAEPPIPEGLSFMGAQAVRIQIREFTRA